MKQMSIISYRYRDRLGDDDYRHMTKQFLEFGEGPQPIAHYERLDGQGGFVLREFDQDPEKVYEAVLRYSPYLDFEVIPVTTIEDAFPIITSVYG